MTAPVEAERDVQYNVRGLAKLSRAIHKIVFEAVAWRLYTQGHADPVDLFSKTFNPVRRWVREGQPQNLVRPFLWSLSQKVAGGWSVNILKSDTQMVGEVKLFIDLYTVSLTAEPAMALGALKPFAGGERMYCIADAFTPAKLLV